MHTLLLLVSLAASPSPRIWKLDTGPTPKVDVSSVEGTVRVRGTSAQTVSVKARYDEGSGWKVEVEERPGRVEVRACCGECGRSTFKMDSCDGEVELDVEVPTGAQLRANAVSAHTTVEGVQGRVEAAVVSGELEVRGTVGPVQASSVSGNVKVSPERVGRTQVNSVSGDVRLALPAKSSARVAFATLSGERTGPRQVGEGAEHIEVSTVSGDLEVEQR